MVSLPFSSRRLLAAFQWCWRAVALVTPSVLSLPVSPSNGSQQILPSRAGKSRYRIGPGSPCRWRRRAESVAGQQFRAARRAGDKPLPQLSVAFALLLKCATATHPHVGGSTPALLSTPTNAMTPAKSKTLNPTMTSMESPLIWL
jgi:hypothetical protein